MRSGHGLFLVSARQTRQRSCQSGHRLHRFRSGGSRGADYSALAGWGNLSRKEAELGAGPRGSCTAEALVADHRRSINRDTSSRFVGWRPIWHNAGHTREGTDGARLGQSWVDARQRRIGRGLSYGVPTCPQQPAGMRHPVAVEAQEGLETVSVMWVQSRSGRKR